MNKKILITTILLLAAVILFAIPTAVKAEEISNPAAEINGTKYATLDEALHKVQNGETIKLLKEITVGQNNVASTGDSYSDNGKVGRIPPLVGESIKFTLDLNGQTITSANNGQGTFYVEDGSTMTITDSGNGGKIEHTGGRSALLVKKGEVILEGGTYTATNASQTYGAIQVGAAAGTAGILTVKSGVTISGNYGIGVVGTGSNLTVKGGSITTESFAISGNGSQTTNSTITISGGTITSTGTAAIYHPNTGTLTVKDEATVTGKVGIVARQGTINIEGGKVIGTDTGSGQVGDAKEDSSNVSIPFGAAIVVDNKSNGYSNTAKVNISDGILNSVNEDTSPVMSYTGKDTQDKDGVITDFAITGGEFSSPFNKELITSGLAEVSIEKSGDARYYVGKTAVEAVNNAEVGSHVTVEKGTLEIASLPSGVTFEGAVTVTNPSSSGDTVETIKSNLQALIAKAEGEENASAELTNAINTAKAVLAKAGATYGELQQALANLQSAYDNFKGGNANANQEIVSGNNENTTGDKGKLDNEPKMGESIIVPAIVTLCVVLTIVVKVKRNK